jgi:bifunctional non-homologous end joining protein LigD
VKTWFVLHQHSTSRRHFDLRLFQDDVLRTWSMLQEPPQRTGQRRLAIERESLPASAMGQHSVCEQAFGEGRVFVWDRGGVEITPVSARHLRLVFEGAKLAGKYRLKQMGWYPGNHWLLEKDAAPRQRPGPGSSLRGKRPASPEKSW